MTVGNGVIFRGLVGYGLCVSFMVGESYCLWLGLGSKDNAKITVLLHSGG